MVFISIIKCDTVLSHQSYIFAKSEILGIDYKVERQRSLIPPNNGIRTSLYYLQNKCNMKVMLYLKDENKKGTRNL